MGDLNFDVNSLEESVQGCGTLLRAFVYNVVLLETLGQVFDMAQLQIPTHEA